MENTTIIFAGEEHKKFYLEKMMLTKKQDCYHEALFYIIGITQNARAHFDRIYDMKCGYIKTECLHEGWQTGGSARAIRLAFNLFTNGTPSIDDYECESEQIDECQMYSVSDIFCCDCAPYFWQGIKLRYPSFC